MESGDRPLCRRGGSVKKCELYFDVDFLHAIRVRELESALAYFPPPPARVLEIGAGTGGLARVLAERGYHVDALDIEGSIYEPHRVFPVTIYDGRNIPFSDHAFDVV